MRVHEELKIWYETHTEYYATKRRNFIKILGKPIKPIADDYKILFESFGGFRKYDEWEFTYDPRKYLNYAIDYGFPIGLKNNFTFIPPQIKRQMLSYINVGNNANVFVPYYGYGEYPDSWIVTKNKEFCLPYDGWNHETERYDGIFLKPPLNHDTDILYKTYPLLSSKGIVVCIANTATTKNKQFYKFIANFDFCKIIEIPFQIWSVSPTNRCLTSLIILKKGKYD